MVCVKHFCDPALILVRFLFVNIFVIVFDPLSCCSASAPSEQCIATKLHNVTSSAFLKERIFITCQRTAMTGEAKHTQNARGVLVLFSLFRSYFPNKAPKCIDCSLTSLCRWRGDHGGKVQYFFPANYVEEVCNNFALEAKDEVDLKVYYSIICIECNPKKLS